MSAINHGVINLKKESILSNKKEMFQWYMTIRLENLKSLAGETLENTDKAKYKTLAEEYSLTKELYNICDVFTDYSFFTDLENKLNELKLDAEKPILNGTDLRVDKHGIKHVEKLLNLYQEYRAKVLYL